MILFFILSTCLLDIVFIFYLEKFCYGVKGLTIFFQDVENGFFFSFSTRILCELSEKVVFLYC